MTVKRSDEITFVVVQVGFLIGNEYSNYSTNF